MKNIKARIIGNKRAADKFYKMRIESRYLAGEIRPGQFLEVLCAEADGPFLRRPFSAHRILGDGVEMLYEVVGSATEALSRRKPGDALDVIGPLGHGFDIFSEQRTANSLQEKKIRTTNNEPFDKLRVSSRAKSRDEPRITILIAGGIGVAPLVALAESVAQSGDLIVLIGAKTRAHLLCEKDFKKLGAKAMVATDDGSKGHKGFITDLLKILPVTGYRLPVTIYACGPYDMMKAVAGIAAARRMRCQVSLEERMACGVGVCLGCPVRVKRGPISKQLKAQSSKEKVNYEYKMVCKDGPVFDAEEIVW